MDDYALGSDCVPVGSFKMLKFACGPTPPEACGWRVVVFAELIRSVRDRKP